MNANWQHISDYCEPYHKQMLASTQHARESQERVLKEILSHNANSEFGIKHRFSEINSIAEYQSRIELHRYEDLRPTIQRIADGETNLLYSDNTLALEPTSGSASAAKLIPLTQQGLRYLQHSILCWIYDLIRHYPKICDGSMYWSISPQTRKKQQSKSGIPIGLDSDIGYLDPNIAGNLVQQMVLVDGELHGNDIEKWRLISCYHLLCAEDLSLISVWSPTFILELLRYIEWHIEELIEFIRCGQHDQIKHRFEAKPQRAEVVREAVLSTVLSTSQAPFKFSSLSLEQIWPKFQLLSCWTHGSAGRFLQDLNSYFDNTKIQGKGLLATEGVISIPLGVAQDPLLALNSGLFEFVDRQGNIYLCDELNIGSEYRVITTFANGLYRYDSGDYVRVSGYYQQAPMLRFVGRSSLNSDICGEKLNEAFIAEQLANVNGFAMLAPSLTPRPHYVLYLDKDNYDDQSAKGIASTLEQALWNNPQYEYARQLKQLDPLSMKRVNNPTERYIQSELNRGKLLGDIKLLSLRPETNWSELLR